MTTLWGRFCGSYEPCGGKLILLSQSPSEGLRPPGRWLYSRPLRSASGGIGRRARLRAWWELNPVEVQVLSCAFERKDLRKTGVSPFFVGRFSVRSCDAPRSLRCLAWRSRNQRPTFRTSFLRASVAAGLTFYRISCPGTEGGAGDDQRLRLRLRVKRGNASSRHTAARDLVRRPVGGNCSNSASNQAGWVVAAEAEGSEVCSEKSQRAGGSESITPDDHAEFPVRGSPGRPASAG